MTILFFDFISVFSVIAILLAISLILSVGLAIYSLRIQSNKASNAFGILMSVISIWVILKIVSLFIFSYEIREILHLINILIVILITPLLLLVAIFHTNIPKWFKKKHVFMLFVFPSVIYLLVFISPFYNLLFYDFKIYVNYDIPIHVFKKKFIYILLDIYNYFLIISAFIVLFKSLSSKTAYFRRQMALFIVGLLIPIMYDSLYILGYSPIKDYNLSPVLLSVGNCFLAWSMFGYRFLKILPVARNLIVDNMHDIMLIISNDSFVVDINNSGEKLFGFKREKIVGDSFSDIFKDYPELVNCYKNNTDIKEITIKRDNSIFYFSISFSSIIIEKQLLATIILLHDISGRINAEKQIRKLSVAIEQSPVTIVITDVDGNIEYVNPAFTAITGYASEEAIGKNPRVLKGLTPDETFSELWQTVLSGQVWKGEFINKKKSGDFYYEDAIITPIKNDKGDIINLIAIKNDITRRKEYENKIQKQNEELKQLNATKDKFFSIIAHDLRNPFSSIVGFSDYLINNFDECEKDEILSHLDNIHKSAYQTYKLLENLLEWSRLSRGLLKPKIQKYNLKVIALEIELFNKELAKAKSISIQNNIINDIHIDCDIEMTRTIMRNLISNAIKFTDNGGAIILSAEKNNNLVEIKIIDTGVGIPEEMINHLFSIEMNTTTKGTENEPGSGLGLILCKELVESQGGKIWVESIIGKGSTFCFTLNQAGLY